MGLSAQELADAAPTIAAEARRLETENARLRAALEAMVAVFGGSIDPDDIDPDMWAWPMLKAAAWSEIVPIRGRQGFWQWTGTGARQDVV